MNSMIQNLVPLSKCVGENRPEAGISTGLPRGANRLGATLCLLTIEIYES